MAKLRKQIAYRPEDDVRAWIDKYAGEGKSRNSNQLVDIAVRFLMAWPEQELFEILGRAETKQLKEYINPVLPILKGRKISKSK